MASSFESTAQSAAKTIGDTAHAAADDFSAASSKIQAQATEQMDRLSQSIRSKPLQSAAIAAGLGFVFAVIARR